MQHVHDKNAFTVLYCNDGTVRRLQSKEASILWSHNEEQCQVHEGEEDHARPGWTTSRRGQDSPWKSQPE